MADTYVFVQVKVTNADSASAPYSGLNVKYLANEVARLVRQQLPGLGDQYGQPGNARINDDNGNSNPASPGNEASHGSIISVTDAIVRSTQAA